MTPLAQQLAQLIAQAGPIPVSRFMAEALLHPEHGYYTTRDPLGRAGDFITAPEISQMFGELIGLWCADTWIRLGRPARIFLVELGPGRGTQMADMLRAARTVPDFHAAIEPRLIEASPVLRASQQRKLAGGKAHWHQRFADLPDAPAIVIANEFFDSLPIRQFVRGAEGWHERLVDLGPSGAGLRFTLAALPQRIENELPPDIQAAPEGSIAEICPAGRRLADEIARYIIRNGGAALIIDYGPARSGAGDSLQAVKQHRPHPVLAEAGTADLTAHVDFQALGRAARQAGASTYGPLPQGLLLERLGIAARAARLRGQANAAQARDIDAGLARLTGADAMGGLFKALALAAPELGPLAGFES